MLHDAGIDSRDILFSNLISAQPPGNHFQYFCHNTQDAKKSKLEPWKGLYPRAILLDEFARLQQQIAAAKPKVIVTLGNWPLHFLTGLCKIENKGVKALGPATFKTPTGIGNWRGSYLSYRPSQEAPEIPLVPTYHPAAIMRMWPWRFPACHDLRVRVKPLMRGLQVPDPGYNFTIPTTLKEALDILDFLDRQPALTYDVETYARTWIACLGFGWSDRDAVCFPFLSVERNGAYWTKEEWSILWPRFRKLLTNPAITLIAQNGNYDMQFLHDEFLIHPKLDRDTLLAQHVLYPGTPKSLDYLSSLYCRYHKYWKEDLKDWDVSIPEKQFWEYNCEDCVRTFEVAESQEFVLKKEGLWPQYLEKMREVYLAYELTQRGCRINKQTRNNLMTDFMQEMEHTDGWLRRIMPKKLTDASMPKTGKAEWFASPTQTATIFYDLLGLSEIPDKKSKERTVNDDALQLIAVREPILRPVCEKLQYSRSLGTIYRNTLAKGLDADGRLRCFFKPGGAETFRWASSETSRGTGTNLQNVSKGEEEIAGLPHKPLPNIRQMFEPDPGYILIDVDLAGADAQVVAWEANDEEWKEAFRKGLKVHAINARAMFGDQAGPDGKAQPIYDQNKIAVHATDYGAKPMAVAFGVARAPGGKAWPIPFAEQWQARWFQLHPGIKKWHERTMETLQKYRGVTNAFGYRIKYFDRVESLLPEALAWIPQSTVAITCFRGALRVRQELRWVQTLLQVHDSLLAQIPISRIKDMPLIGAALRNTIPYPDPLTIQWSLKASYRNWAAAKPIPWEYDSAAYGALAA